MTTKTIRFADFTRILHDLGFASRKVDFRGPRIVFGHKPTDTIMVVDPMSPEDIVPARHLIEASVVFPGRGVATEEQLETLFEEASVKVAI